MTLAEFIESGGAVSVAGRPLEEISPRALRYLFAIGAIGRAKGAAGGMAKGPARREVIKQTLQHQVQYTKFIKQRDLAVAGGKGVAALHQIRQSARALALKIGTKKPVALGRSGVFNRTATYARIPVLARWASAAWVAP